jgi:hypothetical protein
VGHNVTQPGWYVDPQDASRLRWWDGFAWTAQVAARPYVPPTAPAHTPSPAPVLPTPVAPLVLAASPAQALMGSSPSTPAGLADLEARVAALRTQYDELRQQIIETSDVMLLQEIGLYKYAHPLDNSDQYKPLLAQIEADCKQQVKDGSAVTATKKWAINGSDKDGARMVADFSKLILRAYNNEADNVVRTLRPYSVDPAIARLDKLRASIAKLGTSMKLGITDGYHALRVREVQLTGDYLAKLAEEREAQREERARLREEEKVRREFQAEQDRLEKERTHYANVLATLQTKGDAEGAAKAASQLAEIQHALAGVLDRSANIRAGYVYVISNIGAFGKRMVKIGLTRRLEPMDRVRELGDASVPFHFDVHAMIFSDDAVGLETALHREFEAKRVNLVNARREFFYASAQEVRDVLHRLRGSLLSYVDDPEALEWHQSEGARRANQPDRDLSADHATVFDDSD